ncbi:phosphotransferase enzyme family protein [Mycolicibacterium hassiacum DSM 44199]|jgi:hypothetical protein|uniref:Phosphotransferase enzyme family protein n=1 Tax=Mycolicibacterium hassiacum (strain DSM 44199 / CIP 105218 / JCM 12690 / 3849) TaxID=1122247 RepID=K5BGN2_MYCHD|nr:phosphotransferase [Mycolicibacterium hassiacum]EKF24161.1 phosphotransferase enzyme family protein [Mycolicibacterium hassiacum DSM 44199]MDA4085089.1 phosphotransferase [Mycolicibacterium hassiacum DSM 44199]PZN19746.1 MAG: phosphotransferase [Mycolicibacterium hassiacum]VCT90600.1 hypothetical protein MHAS_02309 [Mycolicibacterium hassiacum DSM 44199]
MPVIPTDPHDVTPAWLGDVLQAEVRTCRLEQIAVGVGLVGRLFRVHLDADRGPPTVVVKLPNADPAVNAEVCAPLQLYPSEVRFYQQIGLANPLPPARPYFAAYDETTHDFVLVLEDLGRLRCADQIDGCSLTDAETVVDVLADHHAFWWNHPRLAALPWLKCLTDPTICDALQRNYASGYPVFVEIAGSELSPRVRDFADRFASLIPWFARELTRPPHTFLHGDLRLDQLFFGVDPADPPLTALDWQNNAKGRGAYDLAYFLSQSLPTDLRRSCETPLIDRYAQRLAERGIAYPGAELRRDYRLTATWCLLYPVLAAGRLAISNDRNVELIRAIVRRAAAAIEDHDGFTLGPD